VRDIGQLTDLVEPVTASGQQNGRSGGIPPDRPQSKRGRA
jgi:hypothetical protein